MKWRIQEQQDPWETHNYSLRNAVYDFKGSWDWFEKLLSEIEQEESRAKEVEAASFEGFQPEN